MVNETDQLHKPDYIHNIQYSARDLSVPKFGKVQEIRGGNTRPVRSIAFSCDGKKVATGCDVRGLRVWDVKEKMDSTTSFSLPQSGEKGSPHGGHVASLAWSPVDPHILVSGDRNSTSGTYIAIWDIRSPKSAISTHKLPSDILSISFHPSGSHFAVVCPRPTRDEIFFFHRVTDIDGAGERWVKRSDVGVGGSGVDLAAEEINSLRYSNSGKFVAGVSNDGSLNAWSYPMEPRILTPPTASPLIDNGNAEAGPSSRQGSRENTPEDQDAIPSANSGGNEGEDVDMTEATVPPPSRPSSPSRPSKSSASALSRKSAGPSTHKSSSPQTGRTAINEIIAPAPVSISIMDEAALSRARQLKLIKHSIIHSASLLSLGFDPTGKYLAVGGQDALLSLLTTRDWICTRTFDVSLGAIRYIAFSPDGELIAFGGEDHFLYMVSVHSGQTISKLPIGHTLTSLCWHPKKNLLAWSITSKGAIVWYMIQQE